MQAGCNKSQQHKRGAGEYFVSDYEKKTIGLLYVKQIKAIRRVEK